MAGLPDGVELEDNSATPIARDSEQEIIDWQFREECSAREDRKEEAFDGSVPLEPHLPHNLDLVDRRHKKEQSDWILKGESEKIAIPEKEKAAPAATYNTEAVSKVTLIQIKSSKRKQAMDAIWRTVKGLSHARM